MVEPRRVACAGGDRLDQRARGGVGDVDKGDARALTRERLDQPGADPRAAAADEDAFIGEARIVRRPGRSEEHTSEIPSLMRISYDVFCLKKNTTKRN